MRHLMMADRWEANGDVEAEPILATVQGGRLRLELDDGQVLDVEIADIVTAMVLDDEDDRDQMGEAA